MSLHKTKDHLVQLLSDEDNRVIALTGKWGTGKSHLWGEVKAASQDGKVKNALYVSLFGLSDINQIKLKIVQSAIPNAEANPALWSGIGKSVKGISKVLEGIHKGFSALSDLALLAVPSILKGRVIVLDDIERMHDKLSIDEVLGFIDEFTQQHDARFVLIFNSDKLAKKDVWEVMREKVVDQELRLDTTPSEAFTIAIGLTPSPYAAHLEKIIELCRITNIRIIRKVIRAVNRILGNRQSLPDAVLSRVIPSTVLLSAIHYKGIDDGPDFEFVLSTGSADYWTDFWKEKDRGDELDENGKRRARWRLLFRELGINGCDEYEVLVVEYLQSGLFDVSAVSAIIDRYLAETEIMEVKELTSQFYEKVYWHYQLTEEDLIALAKDLEPKVYLLDPYSITTLYDLLLDLQDGKQIGDSMIACWIDHFRTKQLEDHEDDGFFRRPIHPLLQAEFDAVKAQAQAKTTLYDTCAHIVKHSGWGNRQEMVMKSATIEDFKETIKSLDIPKLKFFLPQMLKMCTQRQNYDRHFGSAVDHFIAACKGIYNETDSGRLGKLILNLFKEAKADDLLKENGA